MLESISIRNLVLIDKLDLDFEKGLGVLTGETGAGKSILLDALGLVLGNRADTGLIRNGTDKLGVSAEFRINNKNHPIFSLLKEFEIESDENISIKRVLGNDGKGKIFVNDQTVSLKLLKEIGNLLVEIHGQFDNHGLLNPNNHLDVLDAYGNYPEIIEKVKSSFQKYNETKKQRKNAETSFEKAKLEEENLKHWVLELEKAKIISGEEETLLEKRAELMNAEKLLANLNTAFTILTEGSNVSSAISAAQNSIYKANDIVSGKYDEIINLLEQAMINSNEAIIQIENIAENISMDNNELNNIEQRLFNLKALARKHLCEVSELPNILEKFSKELASIELGFEHISKLRKEEELAKTEYIKNAKTLSEMRKKAAKRLDENVMKELPPLKMEKAKFVTIVEPLEESSWKASGTDTAYFSVATNPSSPQGPINKIASGGELARFMLALKLNLAETSNIETMIFDEVDTGIGGATAEAVGERLEKLGKDVQILVVTHAPQVAAKGRYHFKVEKNTIENITTTKVSKLNKIDTREEIARMLSGENITDQARAQAEVLLSNRQN